MAMSARPLPESLRPGWAVMTPKAGLPRGAFQLVAEMPWRPVRSSLPPLLPWVVPRKPPLRPGRLSRLEGNSKHL